MTLEQLYKSKLDSYEAANLQVAVYQSRLADQQAIVSRSYNELSGAISRVADDGIRQHMLEKLPELPVTDSLMELEAFSAALSELLNYMEDETRRLLNA